LHKSISLHYIHVAVTTTTTTTTTITNKILPSLFSSNIPSVRSLTSTTTNTNNNNYSFPAARVMQPSASLAVAAAAASAAAASDAKVVMVADHVQQPKVSITTIRHQDNDDQLEQPQHQQLRFHQSHHHQP
jgi:hypothetical protein